MIATYLITTMREFQSIKHQVIFYYISVCLKRHVHRAADAMFATLHPLPQN